MSRWQATGEKNHAPTFNPSLQARAAILSRWQATGEKNHAPIFILHFKLALPSCPAGKPRWKEPFTYLHPSLQARAAILSRWQATGEKNHAPTFNLHFKLALPSCPAGKPRWKEPFTYLHPSLQARAAILSRWQATGEKNHAPTFVLHFKLALPSCPAGKPPVKKAMHLPSSFTSSSRCHPVPLASHRWKEPCTYLHPSLQARAAILSRWQATSEKNHAPTFILHFKLALPSCPAGKPPVKRHFHQKSVFRVLFRCKFQKFSRYAR
jgi:hypothetical protein